MSVITEIRINPDDFELGQILSMEAVSAVELETLVPSQEATVPLLWVYEPTDDEFRQSVERHPDVNSLVTVDAFEDQTLFRLDWDASQDRFFQCIMDNDGAVLSASGMPARWEFEIRFPDREALSRCEACCESADVPLEIVRIYNPTEPGTDPWYGLSDPQREALALAVEMGYYEIPRRCTTVELAEELGISDQAVTERLRRAIDTFGTHAQLASENTFPDR